MPILQGAISFSRFHAEHREEFPKDIKGWLTRGLRSKAFEPLDPKSEEDRAAGFVELENPERAEFASGDLFQGERALFAWRVDELKVSARTLKSELEKWAAAFQQEKGREPRRAEKAEARDALRRKLRTRTEPKVKVLDVSWNLTTHQVQVWATSRKLVDEIQAQLEDRLHVRLVPRTPAAFVQAAAVDVETLTPTAELFGAGLDGEVSHGS